MTALERINASEAAAHRLAGRSLGVFGPLVVVANEQQTPLNSAWLDGSRLPTDAELDDLEAFCRHHAQPVTIHALSHVAPALIPVLRARGYSISYVLHVYAHDLHHLPERTGPAVRPEHDAGAWAQWSALGFGPDSLDTMRLVAQHPQVQRFVAEHQQGGPVMASAALQVTQGVGALYGMSTRPEYRGLGAQRALLAHRLHAAHQQGAELASVAVTPGTPSERNIRWAGFQLVGMRLTFTR